MRDTSVLHACCALLSSSLLLLLLLLLLPLLLLLLLLQAGQAAPVAPKSATKQKAEKLQLSADAQAAVAAVDAAARALLELDPEQLVFMKSEGFGGAVDMEPSAPGSKVGSIIKCGVLFMLCVSM
jgi:hypothetical protein